MRGNRSPATKKHLRWEFAPGRAKAFPATCEFVSSAASSFPGTGHLFASLRVEFASPGVPSESQESSSERPEGSSEAVEFASCHPLSIRKITPLEGKYREAIHRHWEFGRGAGKRFPATGVRSRTSSTTSSRSEPARGAMIGLAEHRSRLRAALWSHAAVRVRFQSSEGRSQAFRRPSARSVVGQGSAEMGTRRREDAPRDPSPHALHVPSWRRSPRSVRREQLG